MTLEVAVSVVLLVGAGLFLRSFAGLQRVDLGLDVDRVAVVEVALPEARYPTADDRAAFVRSLVARLDALPGVVHSAPSQGIPPDAGGIGFGLEFEPEGGERRPYEGVLPFNRAAPGYFEALGTDFVDGRLPVAADVDVRGVVIDRELARLVFDHERVAGRRFRLDADAEWLTVVGVVSDLRLSGPDDQDGSASLVYVDDFSAPPGYLSFVVRTEGDPAGLLPGMRSAVLSVDPELPLRTLQTAESALADALVRPRFLVLLISVLAGVALLLAAVGIFGVLAYAVSRRRREMGIRMALGARAAEVRSGVMRWGLGLAVVGTGAGLVAASLLDDVAATLLYAVEPGDPLTRVGVAGAMLLVAALACWIPAVRATRVDPVEVLREE